MREHICALTKMNKLCKARTTNIRWVKVNVQKRLTRENCFKPKKPLDSKKEILQERISSLHTTLGIQTAYNPRYLTLDKKLFIASGPLLNFL